MKRTYWTDTIFCTLFVFVFLIVTYWFTGIFDVLKPLSQALKDFEMTDLIYARRVAADGSTYNLQDDHAAADTNIVLVNIGTLDREGIAAEVEVINAQKPRLIAIDTVFEQPTTAKADSLLAAALGQVEHLILGVNIYQSSNNQKDSLGCYYAPLYANAQKAALGFASGGRNKVTRDFYPIHQIGDSLIPSFAAQMAKIAYPHAYEHLQERNNTKERINYRRTDLQYITLDVQDIFNPELAVNLKDKVVILGYMGQQLGTQSWEVKYYTPLNEKYIGKTAPDMFEAAIHANTLSMIKDGDYLNQMPQWLCVLLGIALCLLNVRLFLWVNQWFSRWYDAVTKLLQFIEIALLLYVVLLVFSYFHYKIDLTLGLTALLFAGDLLEVYTSVVKNFALLLKTKMPRF